MVENQTTDTQADLTSTEGWLIRLVMPARVSTHYFSYHLVTMRLKNKLSAGVDNQAPTATVLHYTRIHLVFK